MAQSFGPRWMPIAAVSSGARPVYTFSGSYPNSDSVATSDAGVSDGGTLFDRPTTPACATRSMFGIFAACSGVRSAELRDRLVRAPVRDDDDVLHDGDCTRTAGASRSRHREGKRGIESENSGRQRFSLALSLSFSLCRCARRSGCAFVCGLLLARRGASHFAEQRQRIVVEPPQLTERLPVWFVSWGSEVGQERLEKFGMRELPGVGGIR